MELSDVVDCRSVKILGFKFPPYIPRLSKKLKFCIFAKFDLENKLLFV